MRPLREKKETHDKHWSTTVNQHIFLSGFVKQTKNNKLTAMLVKVLQVNKNDRRSLCYVENGFIRMAHRLWFK